MAFTSGRNGGLMLADGSTTKRNISSYLTSIDYANAGDSIDVTTFNSTQSAKTYVPGLRDRTISFDGFADPTCDGYLNGAFNKIKPFSYYASSTASTNTNFIRYSGNGILTKYDFKTSVDGAVEFSGEIQITGSVVRSTASS